MTQIINRNPGERMMLRRMGYHDDQQEIRKSHIRELDNWKLHIDNTKKFILKSAETKNKETAIILGSGWLFNIPLEELAKEFKNIYLVDIKHPSQITKKVNELPNVTLVNDDLTGGVVSKAYELVKKDKKHEIKSLLSVTTDTQYTFHTEPDFVVSLNVFHWQLNTLIKYMRKFTTYSDAELHKIITHIQVNHINCLPAKKTCFISSFEEELLDEQNNMVSIKPTLFVDLPKGNFENRWTWKYDNFKSYHENYNTNMNIIAKDF